jgi:iron complex transport system permease protein
VVTRGIALLLGLLLVATAVRVSFGPVSVDGAIRMAFDLPSSSTLALRGSAVFGAALLGGALGLSGLALQVLLRNPLAEPFVLGVSSGAGFGVALVLAGAYAFSAPAVAFGGEAGGAIVGAAATLGLVIWLSRSREGHDPTRLILAGVIVGSVFASATMLVEQMVPHGLRGDLMSWMAGRLPEIPEPQMLWVLAILVAAAALFMLWRARALDVACLSDDEVLTSGVSLGRLRAQLFLVAGALAAAAVAFAGPIGFVGLVAPHAARRLVGPSHRALVMATLVAGAALLVFADCVRQFIDVGTGRLPIGVVTALAGGPTFLWLLRRTRWTA